MTTFTDVEAGRQLTTVLARAEAEGVVRITDADGTAFVIRPVAGRHWPSGS